MSEPSVIPTMETQNHPGEWRATPVPDLEEDGDLQEQRPISVAANERLDGTTNYRSRQWSRLRSPDRYGNDNVAFLASYEAYREWDRFCEAFVSGNAYMMGKAKSREINQKDLNQKTLKLFTGEQGSIWKEWQNWLRYKAVIPLTEKEVSQLPKHIKIVGMRWVHTDKDERKRVPGTKTANLEVSA
jgi:hypothetical protein